MARPHVPKPDMFSLFEGDPFFRLMKGPYRGRHGRLFLFGSVLAVWLVTWLPLLVLSALEARAVPGQTDVPFLHDFFAHIRFLFISPLFLLMPVFLEPKIRETLLHFINAGIIDEDATPRYHNAVKKTGGLIGSVPALIILLVIVIAASWLDVRGGIGRSTSTWQLMDAGESFAMLSKAGWWTHRVSIPVFQFLLFRSTWHYLCWMYFLLRVSLIRLNLVPSHPDKAGGIRFLGMSQILFTPFFFGISSLYASGIGMEIIYGGATLYAFRNMIVLFFSLTLTALLLPLLAFFPRLAKAKRTGLLEYDLLAGSLLRSFNLKWMTGKPAAGKDILSANDPSATTDFMSVYLVLKDMKIVPFDLRITAVLLMPVILPMLPLLLTVVSPAQIAHLARSIVL